jgi:hypothetical protein
MRSFNQEKAMRKILVAALGLLTIFIFPNYGDSLDQKYHDGVQHFIDCIKNNDKNGVIKLTSLPFKRKFPLPSIKTAEDFLQRYDDVFDKNFIEIISSSDIHKDWETANAGGYGAIMLKNGMLWLDTRGKLISVNYESEVEKIKRLTLIEAEKKKLHFSLQTFLEPVLEWKTKNYHIRIDKLAEWKYRYAVWPVDKAPSEKPDLILNNGEYIPDGGGTNYDFKNGVYKYSCVVIHIGTEQDPPGYLEVYKNEKLILSEPVVEVRAGYQLN